MQSVRLMREYRSRRSVRAGAAGVQQGAGAAVDRHAAAGRQPGLPHRRRPVPQPHSLPALRQPDADGELPLQFTPACAHLSQEG